MGRTRDARSLGPLLVLVAIGIAAASAVLLYRRHPAAPPPSAAPDATGPYNVLLISLDTVRQDVVGAYGHRPRGAPTLSTTPALDQLAREGVRMVDAYAASSWTLPSHLSMMTGMSALQHGVETEGVTLDPSIETMAGILQSHGYRTIGVYSAPYLDPHWGFGRGFDAYRAVYGAEVDAASQRASEVRGEIDAAVAASDWARYDELKRKEAVIDTEMNDASQTVVTSEQVASTVVSELATLARENRPWFVFAHFFDAHCDYVPPPPYDTRFDPSYTGSFTGKNCMGGPAVGRPDPDRPGALIRELSDRDLAHAFALYEGEVGWVDAHVAAIMRALDDLSLARKTLVVVVADHGEEFFEHAGLGHRRTLYDEVVRVPMILRLPAVLPAAASVRGLVSLSDVLPTVLDIVGVAHAPAPGSSSFLPLIHGRADGAERTMMSRFVMMFGGDVEVDATEHVTLRQVVVEDAFRRGPIKITRRRSWPQFQAGLRPEVSGILQTEAATQYAREDLRWIDVERFPAEPDEQRSAAFNDPAARATLDAFRRQYTQAVGLRTGRPAASKLPQNIRLRLESLGYLERSSGPEFPEPDIVLPAPGRD